MKRFFILLLGLSLSANSLAESDPKTEHLTQAVMALTGAITSFATGVALMSIPNPSGITAVQASAAFMAGDTQLVVSGLSFNNAMSLEGDTTADSGQSDTSLSGNNDSTGIDGSSGAFDNDNAALRNRVAELRQQAQEQRQDLEGKIQHYFGKDVDIDDVSAHPEKYFSEEEMAGLNEAPPPGQNTDTDLETDEAQSHLAASQDLGRNLASFDIRSGGVTPSLEAFDFDKFLAGSLLPGHHSAPGYYGNVKLAFLKPGSKLTLFERVSEKIKKIR